jgi:hypothetical protein
VNKFPKSIATIKALKIAPDIVAQLPQNVAKGCPNYADLQSALIGTPKMEEPTGVAPLAEPALPAAAQTLTEQPVAGATVAPEDLIKAPPATTPAPDQPK